MNMRGMENMRRELGIGRCGLACCLCSENDHCNGCSAGDCPDQDWCENRKCSLEKGIDYCYDCPSNCRSGMQASMRPYGFGLFVKRYGMEALLNCLEANERRGVVYHREGLSGDYDGFDDVEELIAFIRTGERP